MSSNGTVPPPLPSVNVEVDVARAASRVSAPAIAMMIVSGLAIFGYLLAVLFHALGVAVSLPSIARGRARGLETFASGGLGVAVASVAILAHAFVIVGALKMRNLQSYGLAMAAAIVSMIPCSCCCFVPSMAFGIWALVVLLDKNVEAAFARG